MKVFKSIIVFIAFAIMLLVLLFLDTGVIINAMAGAYIAAVGAFLGVDLAAMLKQSSLKAAGDYEKLNAYKYIIGFVQLGVLFIVTIVRINTVEIDISAIAGMFGTGAIAVIGMVLAGLEGNKIATGAST